MNDIPELIEAKNKFRNLFFGIKGFLLTRKSQFDDVVKSIIDATIAYQENQIYYIEYIDADHIQLIPVNKIKES